MTDFIKEVKQGFDSILKAIPGLDNVDIEKKRMVAVIALVVCGLYLIGRREG